MNPPPRQSKKRSEDRTIGKKSLASARKKAEKQGLNKAERTLWMCVDRGTAKCASKDQMAEAWKHLRRRLKSVGRSDSLRAFAAKTQCWGVCRGGPLMCVMPDGVWYGGCTPEVIDEIIDRHLLGGEIVRPYVIAEGPG